MESGKSVEPGSGNEGLEHGQLACLSGLACWIATLYSRSQELRSMPLEWSQRLPGTVPQRRSVLDTQLRKRPPSHYVRSPTVRLPSSIALVFARIRNRYQHIAGMLSAVFLHLPRQKRTSMRVMSGEQGSPSRSVQYTNLVRTNASRVGSPDFRTEGKDCWQHRSRLRRR